MIRIIFIIRMFKMPNNQILRIISNETKATIEQMDIVTPSIYASFFEKFASEHHEFIENEKDLAVDLIQHECSNLTDMQTEATQSANTLTNNTDKAISAIKKKDEKALNEVLEETNKLKLEIEKLKEAVYKDELTHANNRKWLHDTYLNEDSETLKTDGIMALIDLNYFKQVNDTYGHIIGDKVLIFIANQLKSTHEQVVRYGGDEFLVMFEAHNSLHHAIDKLSKIREAIISKKLKAHDAKFTVSFSFGVIPYKQGDALAKTIELADKNMYNDKIMIKKRVTGI